MNKTMKKEATNTDALGKKRQCPNCGIWFYDMIPINAEFSEDTEISCPNGHAHVLRDFLKLRHVRTESSQIFAKKDGPQAAAVEEDIIEDTEELADDGELDYGERVDDDSKQDEE